MSLKSYKLAQKSVFRQQELVKELQAFVRSIERGEKMINDLKTELEKVNVKHQNRASTQEDIAYLEDLLKCAKKKLAWEKQMNSLQKRTPVILETVSSIVNDPVNPPSDEMRNTMLQLLQNVQSAMERLNSAKLQ